MPSHTFDRSSRAAGVRPQPQPGASRNEGLPFEVGLLLLTVAACFAAVAAKVVGAL